MIEENIDSLGKWVWESKVHLTTDIPANWSENIEIYLKNPFRSQ